MPVTCQLFLMMKQWFFRSKRKQKKPKKLRKDIFGSSESSDSGSQAADTAGSEAETDHDAASSKSLKRQEYVYHYYVNISGMAFFVIKRLICDIVFSEM